MATWNIQRTVLNVLPTMRTRRIVPGIFLASCMSIVATRKDNSGRDFIIKWFGKSAMTQFMANHLAKDDCYLRYIPIRLRSVDIWKKFYAKWNLAGLQGLSSNGKTFNEIIGKNRIFVVPANYDSQKHEHQWGIRFTDVNHLKWLGVGPLSLNVTDYKFNDHEFMWKITIPDDAQVFVGCDQGPSHEHFYHCSCEQEVRADKVEFIGQIKNEYYYCPSPDIYPDYASSDEPNDLNSGG